MYNNEILRYNLLNIFLTNDVKIMATKLTTEEFINRSNKIHNNKYIYDKVNYTLSHNNVIIKCPIHGYFEQAAYRHLAGSGCSECGNKTAKNKLSISFGDFIKKCKDKHNNKYDYSLIDSSDFSLKNRIEIICPNHGQFSLVAVNHMNGSTCKGCRLEKPLTDKQRKYREKLKSGELRKLNHNEWLQRLEANKGNLVIEKIPKRLQGSSIIYYRCDKHNYSNSCSLSAFIANGFNCQLCANEFISNKFSGNTEEFIQKAKAVHGDYYDYSKVNYTNNKNKVEIICPFHGRFKQTAGNHINSKHGCPKCYREFRQSEIFCRVSSQEIKLQKWLFENNISFEPSNRSKIYPLELDLFLPDYNLAIEVNGVYWHSIEFKDKDYHIGKLEKCESNGIRLLQFYDTEIDSNFDMVTGIIQDTIAGNNNLKGKLPRRFYSVLDYCTGNILEPEIETIFENQIWNSGYIMVT